MFSDKKFGLPKDLIDTVKKVVEEHKTNNLNENEEINEIAIKSLSAAGKWISGAASRSSLSKSGKAAPRGIPPSPTGTSVVPSSGGAGKPPAPPSTPSSALTPSGGSKGGPIDVKKARDTAIDIPTTPLKRQPEAPVPRQIEKGGSKSLPPPSSTTSSGPSSSIGSKPTTSSGPSSSIGSKPTTSSGPSSSIGSKPTTSPGVPIAAGVGAGAGVAAVLSGSGNRDKVEPPAAPKAAPPAAPKVEPPAAPKVEPADDNDPASVSTTYDAAPSSPKSKAPKTAPTATPRTSSTPTAKKTGPSTPDLDAPGAVGGSFSRRQASDLGFTSFEDGGKKKRKMTESRLIQAFLDLQEKKHHKKKLDPVGKEDQDVDNDGDVDSSDKYLKKRREAISKNIKEEEIVEESDRISYHKKMIKMIEKKLADDPRNKHWKEKLAYHKKLLSELTEDVEFSDSELEHIKKVLEAVSDKDEQKITGREGSSRKGPTVPTRDLTD